MRDGGWAFGLAIVSKQIGQAPGGLPDLFGCVFCAYCAGVGAGAAGAASGAGAGVAGVTSAALSKRLLGA